MIDVDTEDCFLLAKSKEHVNFSLSPAAAWRWALHGLIPRKSQSRERIKLETVLIGGRRYTSREAIDRFLARLSQAEGVEVAPPKRRAEQITQAADRAAATFG